MDYYNVSVIIPVYNGEKAIGNAITSVLKQNMEGIQIVIVNDGSTDKTEKICKQLQPKNSNILFLSQKNKGVSSARNLGLKNAKGKYVVYLDADDQLEENFCRVMFYQMEEKKADLAVCGFNNVFDNEKRQWLPHSLKNQTNTEEIIEVLIQTGGINMLWNKMYVRKKIKQKFNVEENMGEDLEFIANYLDDVKKIVFVNKCLYNYTSDNLNSLTHVVDVSPKILLYEYRSILHIALSASLNLEQFKDRLIFRSCDQFYDKSYSKFLKKWKKFRMLDGFSELIKSYQASKKVYRIIAIFIKKNFPLPVFILLKIKNS